MAVLPSALRSGEDAKVHTKRANERRSQSPRSVTALAHLGLLCTPDENRHATAGYGKGLLYGRRYDLPKVRHRSTGLRCIDDNAKQKMFQLCEELTAYDTCTESRFFVVLCLITDELTHERETIIVQRTDFVRFCRSFCLKKPTEKLPSFSSNFTWNLPEGTSHSWSKGL